jgi:N-methylhydantoinase B
VIDPITLAVIRGRLERITDEMDAILTRGAFSAVISEAYDRANGIYESATGEIVVQGETGLPLFAVTVQYAVKAVIAKGRQDGVFPGDVFMLNDPHIAGTHLHDVKLIKPVFYEDQIAVFLGNVAHWIDVGGSPGGYNPKAGDLIQEGMIIPPVKIYEKGVLNRYLLDTILANSRLSFDNRGDFHVMLSALEAGEERMMGLIKKYGLNTLIEAISELNRRSEKQMRSYIAQIPDGVYSSTNHLDNDGIEDRPLKIALQLEVKGDSMFFDFSGSSPACKGPYNIAIPTTMASCFIAFKHLFPEIPLNSGCFKSLQFVLPENSVVNSPPDRAQDFYLDTALKVSNAVLEALAQAIPDKGVGLPFACLPGVFITGKDPITLKHYTALVLLLGGGYGGSLPSDGLINGSLIVGAARTPSLEVMEQRFPILYREYSIRDDSGGAGWRAGACGTVSEVEFLGEQGQATVMLESRNFPSAGVLDGHAGKVAELEIYISSDRYELALGKGSGIPIGRGDRIIMKSPGGGGYGNPLKREIDRVIQDLTRGFISKETARQMYGVVVREDGTVNLDETELLRQEIQGATRTGD